MTIRHDNKDGYYKRLTIDSRLDIHHNRTKWMVSCTTDGMTSMFHSSCMTAKDYYKGCKSNSEVSYSYEQAIVLLEKYLDDNHYRYNNAIESLEYVKG